MHTRNFGHMGAVCPKGICYLYLCVPCVLLLIGLPPAPGKQHRSWPGWRDKLRDFL